MNYELDKSGIDNGIIQYTTENGCKYLANIYEIEIGTGVWSLEFIKFSGNPESSDVFKIMRTLTDACMEYVYEKNITSAILFISGGKKEEIEQKTKIFQRWLENDWSFEVISGKEVDILGRKFKISNTDAKILTMTRKQS